MCEINFLFLCFVHILEGEIQGIDTIIKHTRIILGVKKSWSGILFEKKRPKFMLLLKYTFKRKEIGRIYI